ncbi:MAG TPA: protein translocase subunit SecD [Candidatus Sabulitectum sp.]|nr:protein translocase subunit SecD [Candidatus Sabulitectum sp.]HPJ29242.1 protein translocase subunit SecD [Candidatus Sabulitectum sp.]HPR23057.1 protein translocase subunit SecD [Candidatus Sabulitectum sp.]
MKKADKWRNYSSALVLVISLLLIWPTVKWYSLPAVERDRAEASVQPETTNPYLRSLLDDMQEEGGEELLEEYRELYATSRGTIKLGLDLQGGMYLAYTVEPTPGLDADEALDQALEIIRNRIDEFGVSEPSITRQGSDRIIVQLPGVRDPARARAIVERQALLEFKVVAYPNAEHPSPSTIPVVREIEAALGEELPEEEPIAATETETSDEEEFSLPQTGDDLSLPTAEELQEESALPSLEVAGQLGSLISIADQNTATVLRIRPGDWMIQEGEEFDRLQSIINREEVSGILAEHNLQFSFGKPTELADGTTWMSVFLVPANAGMGWDRQADLEIPHYRLTGASLTDVRIRMGDQNTMSTAPYLLLEFDSEGSSMWERITGENVDERVAILLDGRIYSVATITERISGGTRLSGSFNLEEARDLRLVLKAGSLPARLIIAEEQTIGPSLGKTAISNGMIAGLVGLAIIAAFMMIYYGAGGLIAVLALVFDMVIILGILCFPGPLAQIGIAGMNATLTLPGIAGIILTIGMAVDASVLIYERIREELASGKGIRSAVDAGYSRAFVTIFDANLTTFITALVLYRFGTGPIRGFAVTLSIGIMASMFCSLVFTRAVFSNLLAQVKRTKISLGKLAMVKDAHYDIVTKRKKTYLLSLGVILVGVISFFAHGGLNLSIDFTGGLETNVVSTEYSTAAELNGALTGEGLLSVQVQALQDWTGEGSAFVIRTSSSDKDEVYAALESTGCSLMEDEEGESEASFIKQIGPRVGNELRSQAVDSIMLAMFFIVLYIWYRFQFKWGLAAVAALLHDILITVGLLALFQVEVSLTIIAALLTIVGYSINDTIVVFDRIREDNRLRKGKTFEETVNKGINETLSRTVVTSLTTFVAVLMLFIFGTGEIRDFALTLMIGIIVGTYSSIFVASPILIDWHARLRKK